MTASPLTFHTLILNRNWTPITTATVKRALMLLWVGAAKVVCPDTYQEFDFDAWLDQEVKDGEAAIKTVRKLIKVPEVMVLAKYHGVPQREVSFTRRNLWKRYGSICAYCAEQFRETELTIDHVVPTSRGGKTNWENCVLACYDCNQKKGARTPVQAKMPLKYNPTKPKWSAYALVPRDQCKHSWVKFNRRNK